MYRRYASAIAALALGMVPITAGAITVTGASGGGLAHDTIQPSVAINYVVRTFGSANELGTITMLANDFAPVGYLPADGRLLSTQDHAGLFGALGFTYGGNGIDTFALPDLRGRTPIGAGAGPGLTPRALGDAVGTEQVTLTTDNLPAHDHTLPAPGGDTGLTGGGTPFANLQPSLALNYTINRDGIFPSTFGNAAAPDQTMAFMGLTAGTVVSNFALLAQGQTLPINTNQAFFSLIGTTFGGDGTTTFAPPDLRGRAVIGAGAGPGLTPRAIGDVVGSETIDLTLAGMAGHEHDLPPSSDQTGTTGGDQPFVNLQPSLGLQYLIALQGIFPGRDEGQTPQDFDEPFFGEIVLFAGNFIPSGWVAAEGQILSIGTNQALFSLLGSAYGGDGITTFALPDLRGRVAVGQGQGPGLSTWGQGRRDGSETVVLTIDQLPSHDHTIGDVAPVPEPALLVAFTLGLAGFAASVRRARLNPRGL